MKKSGAKRSGRKPGGQKESKKLALHYMEALVDVARESILLLGADLKVISGNPIFYETFHVKRRETEGVLLFKLGNGQWNIPQLKTLLKKVLPDKKVVRNFEVTHVFEAIGERTILLNARSVDAVQLIILAMEDITLRKQLEAKLTQYTKGLEIKVTEKTKDLTSRIEELESLNKSMVGRELKMVELKKELTNIKKMDRATKTGRKDR